MSKKDYMVLVNCMTYNQRRYILDALEGFVMQKTNFPYVCLVMDDASTDGEQKVVKAFLDREFDMVRAEYSEIDEANIVLVPHKTNPNCTFAVYLLKQNLHRTERKRSLINQWREYCKYEALCEGDDYWTAPDKLQRQVNLLESHPECGLCYTDCDIYYEDTKKWEHSIYNGETMPIDSANPTILSKGWYYANVTWIYRLNVYKDITPNTKFIDGALYLLNSICLKSEIIYSPSVTGVYRRHSGSASCFTNEQKDRFYNYVKNSFELQKMFMPQFSGYSEKSMVSLYTKEINHLYMEALMRKDNAFIREFETFFDNKVDLQRLICEFDKYEKIISDIQASRAYRFSVCLSKSMIIIKRLLGI